MLRFARFALPLALIFAVTGCDAVTDDATAASASAAALPIFGPDTLPVCHIETYSIDIDNVTFKVKGLRGRAEVLGQSTGRRQTSARIGGVHTGGVIVRAYSSTGTLLASKSVTVTPAPTTGGIPTCEY